MSICQTVAATKEVDSSIRLDGEMLNSATQLVKRCLSVECPGAPISRLAADASFNPGSGFEASSHGGIPAFIAGSHRPVPANVSHRDGRKASAPLTAPTSIG